MKSIRPSYAACVVGAGAMLACGTIYIVGGPNGEAPDLAKLTLTTSASGFASVANLYQTYTEALEPGQIKGERPSYDLGRTGGLTVTPSFKANGVLNWLKPGSVPASADVHSPPATLCDTGVPTSK